MTSQNGKSQRDVIFIEIQIGQRKRAPAERNVFLGNANIFRSTGAVLLMINRTSINILLLQSNFCF